jgi:hypothetical protein
VYCGFDEFALVVTQKFSFSKILEVVSRIEFAQDHESVIRSDRGPVVLYVRYKSTEISHILVYLKGSRCAF